MKVLSQSSETPFAGLLSRGDDPDVQGWQAADDGLKVHGGLVCHGHPPDKTVYPLQWHTEKKIPYPTYSRRAQFYIDHPWFLEAGEALPVHKDNPAMGGNYPLQMTSGHLRWSVHSIWITQKLMLQTNRGTPLLFVNSRTRPPADQDDDPCAAGTTTPPST
jgi:nitrate reductase alpha subunit